MIAYVRIENYRSIPSATLDFRSPLRLLKREEELYRWFELSMGRRRKHLLPCLGVWGPNGAGKSNFFRGMRRLLEEMLSLRNPDLSRFYEPNRFLATGLPTRFEIGFYLFEAGRWHEGVYSLAYHATEIVEESLCYDGVERLSREGCRADELAIVTTASFDVQLLMRAFRFIDVRSAGAEGYGKAMAMLALSKAGEAADFMAQVSALLARLDVGIERVGLVTSPDAPPMIATYHKDRRGDWVVFDMSEESEGTQRLILLVAELLIALAEGQLAVIDEMDASLHPILFRGLIRVCRSRAYNTGMGQLCFSTHDVSLMEDALLPPEAVVLAAKAGGETRFEMLRTLMPSIRGPGAMKRFRERYLEGWYQNIPYPSV